MWMASQLTSQKIESKATSKIITSMEHPGVSITQIKRDLKIEEIQEKLRELYKRQAFAYQTNNTPMLAQLEMIIEVYARAQMEILNEMFSPGGDGPDLDDKIDVS